MSRVLLLNADYQPIKVISWQRAMALTFDDKVEVLKEYENITIPTVRTSYACPAVVRLTKYVNLRKSFSRFNRHNVYARDMYQCMYCGDSPSIQQLTYDHVVPKSKGGQTTWENIVTCCITCNRFKADRTPDEAGMELLEKPRKPQSTMTRFFTRNPPSEWSEFLP